ncbi:MAG: hypothetical protein R6U17_04205 [Thermoplasmata archaeon]
MPTCPNCNEDYLQEREGRCPRCGYYIGTNYSTSYPPITPENDIGGTLSTTLDILKENFTVILTFLLIPIIIVSIINIFSIWTIMSSMETLTGDEMELDALINFFSTLYLIALPLSIVVWIIELLFAGGIVGITKESFEGRSVNVDTGLGVIKNHALGVILAGILLSILLSVGIALCIIPGLLFCYWWLFTIPILIIEGKGVLDAMSASKNFAKKNSTTGFTIVIIVLVIVMSGVGNLIASLLSGAFMYSFDFTAQEVVVFGPRVIVSQIIGSIVSVLVTALAIMCITVHYLRGRSYFAPEGSHQYYNTPPPPEPMDWSRLETPDEEERKYDEGS